MFVKENGYTLWTEEVEGVVRYIVRFKDGQNAPQEVEIPHSIFAVLDRCSKKEEALARQDRRWLERAELADVELYDRAVHKPKSVEEEVLENLFAESIAEAIATLSETQARRFRLYYGCGLTLQQIAKAEGCAFQVVARSVKSAENNIKKFLSNEG